MTTTLPKADAAQFHTLSIAEVLAVERVERDDGLSTAEVTARRAAFGPNRFAEARREPRWRAFARQYADPMQLVLLCAGLGSLYPLKQLGTGLLLLALTLFNAVLGLRQEGKAAAAVAALQQMMVVKARVRRDGRLTQVPAEDLVPGDVVLVEAGDLVPADGRLVRAARLEVDESALTGESVPVVKDAATVPGRDAALGDRVDMVYMHTNVTRGTGEVVVTATGMATEVGEISGLLQTDQGAETPLTRQLARLTDQILVVAGVALLVSVAVNLARGNAFNVVFTAAVAFAVSAVPTGLPAVVTTMLSLGTQALARANAIVKRLRSTETLGSTSAINSDKTGTLTLNEMTAVELTLPGRHYTVSGGGYRTDGDIRHTGGEPDVPLEPYLLPLALASDAVVDDGTLVGDPTEGALVVLAAKGHLDVAATRQRYPRLAEVPFDAVAIGRGLYDNLRRYVLFQMGALIGFIVTFLGASVLNIASGVPLLPLQTLWVNFTTQVFQAVGIGSGRPDPGLMTRRPRRGDEPLLSTRTLLGLGVIGLVMGATTLSVIWWADRGEGIGVARTMGLTTFSILNLVLSFTVRSELRSVSGQNTFDDRRFLTTTGCSILAIVVATEAGLFQRLLGTVGLDLRQWLICVAAAVPLLAVAELRKTALRRRAATAPHDQTPAEATL